MVSTCDQVRVNLKAVDQLMDPNCVGKKPKTPTGGLLTYKIRDTTIIHIFDPPHLIKGIRNNLMTKNLSHYVRKRWNISENDFNKNLHEQSPLTASWDDVRDLYHFSSRGSTKLLPKISKEHIDPKKRKMKVSVAAQVFSETYGTVMLQCSQKQLLPRDFSGTAQILLFFNDVFDSFNGSCRYPGKNKLKGSVTESSIHFPFWQYALCMLSNMKFHDRKTGKTTNRTSVLKNFESTIRGYMEVCRKCFDLNISEVSLRCVILNIFLLFAGEKVSVLF